MNIIETRRCIDFFLCVSIEVIEIFVVHSTLFTYVQDYIYKYLKIYSE